MKSFADQIFPFFPLGHILVFFLLPVNAQVADSLKENAKTTFASPPQELKTEDYPISRIDSLQALVDIQNQEIQRIDSSSSNPLFDSSLVIPQEISKPSQLIEDPELYPLSVMLKAQIKFIDFSQRNRFQKSLDRRELELQFQQTDPSNVVKIRAQEFQRVNLAFPLAIGFKFRPYYQLSCGLSGGYLYHQQETLLQIGNASQSWTYALESFPLTFEIAHLIPIEILTIEKVDFLEVGGRIYGHYGDQSILHKGRTIHSTQEYGMDGWSAFLSYQYMAWKRLSIQTELEYATILASSDQTWETLIKDSTEEEIGNASWDIGGIALGFHIMYGFGSPLLK